MDFEIHLRSLRGHKGVKGQIYKDAPIELKFQYNDPYDPYDSILSILKICCNSFEVMLRISLKMVLCRIKSFSCGILGTDEVLARTITGQFEVTDGQNRVKI